MIKPEERLLIIDSFIAVMHQTTHHEVISFSWYGTRTHEWLMYHIIGTTAP